MNGKHSDADRGPLPVVVRQLSLAGRLNPELRRVILELQASVPDQASNHPSGRSYFGNKWLSNDRLHESGIDVMEELARELTAMANRLIPLDALSIQRMWCIVSEPGLTGSRHNHAGKISLAYYVDAGSSGPGDGGELQFYLDPNGDSPTHRFQPEAGQLYLFPAALEHSVSRYDGESPRIVVSANLS